MKLLGEWVGSSMLYSDGTLGGLKPDGTSFHHGGHYPSYSVGAFAAVVNSPMVAATTAMAVMSLAGERAAKRSLGNGSMQVNFLDELFNLTPDRL